MYCLASYGPHIGNDFWISDGACGTTFNHYTDTLGRGDATFTGDRNFTAEDYEVWAVT